MSVSPVTWFTDPGRSIGTSRLHRHDDHVSMKFPTSESMSREAITICWVVFNNPDGCLDRQTRQRRRHVIPLDPAIEDGLRFCLPAGTPARHS